MPDKSRQPDDCRTMEEVRAGVDEVDGDVLRLLARRFAYMRAAARIKPERQHVRDEVRKAEVIANAAAMAKKLGIPSQTIIEIWDRLVEGSITYEQEEWNRQHDG